MPYCLPLIRPDFHTGLQSKSALSLASHFCSCGVRSISEPAPACWAISCGEVSETSCGTPPRRSSSNRWSIWSQAYPSSCKVQPAFSCSNADLIDCSQRLFTSAAAPDCVV